MCGIKDLDELMDDEIYDGTADVDITEEGDEKDD